jgi:hypothetical protein
MKLGESSSGAMDRKAMPRLSFALGALALLAALAAAGCAGPRAGARTGDEVRTLRDPEMSLAQASALVRPGHSTRVGVEAALGPAATVRFGSGHEVWVWRSRVAASGSRQSSREKEPPRAEFIVLFSPSGIAQKTRIRQADGTE